MKYSPFDVESVFLHVFDESQCKSMASIKMNWSLLFIMGLY